LRLSAGDSHPKTSDNRKLLMAELHDRRRQLNDRPTTAKGFRLELDAIALDPIDGYRGHPIDVADICRPHGLGPRHVVPAVQPDKRVFHEKPPRIMASSQKLKNCQYCPLAGERLPGRERSRPA